MKFSTTYLNIKRYLSVGLLTSFIAGSLFGLTVSVILFIFNRQIHNPVEVGFLVYGICLAYGLIGVIGGGAITVFLAIFFGFFDIEPSKSKYFALLTAVLLLIITAVLAFHFFQNRLYLPYHKQFKYYIFLGAVIIYILLMPRILSILERFGSRLGRSWAKKSRRSFYVIGAVALYILTCATFSVGFMKFNFSTTYSPLEMIRPDKTGRKIVLVGWDGANWYVIDKLFKKGLMPNLKKIVDRGVSGTLKSVVPLTSITLWNSIITGKNMLEHGIQDYTSTYIPFTNLNIEELVLPHKLGLDKIYKQFNLKTNLVSSRRRKVPALWDILSIAGYTVGSIGWWTTFPVNRVNGFMISDQFADHRSGRGTLSDKQKSAYIYPRDYYDKLINDTFSLKDLKRSDIYPFMKLNAEDESRLFIKEECARDLPIYQFAYSLLTDKGISSITDKMYRNFRPDFLALYFGGLDPAQHFYWGYMDPGLYEWVDESEIERYHNVVPRYYQFLDEQLGYLMDLVDDNTVIMVLSDHGLLLSPSRAKDEGKHSVYGILACYGPGVKAQNHVRASIYDIAPTVMKMMGLPLADDITGKPIPELFEDGGGAEVDYRRIESYDFLMSSIRRDNIWDRVVSRAVDKRLQAMGYLYR